MPNQEKKDMAGDISRFRLDGGQAHTDFIAEFMNDVANNTEGFELILTYKRGNNKHQSFSYDGAHSIDQITNIMNAHVKERNNWIADTSNRISAAGGDGNPEVE